MTWFICSSSSSNSEYNGDGDYCLVEVRPDDAKRFLRLMETTGTMKKTVDGQLYKLVLWNYDPYWLDMGELEKAGLHALLEEEMEVDYDFQEVEAEWAMTAKDHAIRTEACTISVDDDSVFWRAYVKHTDVVLTSDSLRMDTMKKIAGA